MNSPVFGQQTTAWLPVPGLEGRYQINPQGVVWSLLSNKQIKAHVGRDYPRVPLIDQNGKERMHSVHRLVAMAWVPNPDGKPFVNHIDGNKRNSDSSNLEWVTNSENLRHAFATGLKSQTAKSIAAARINVLRANAAWRAFSADDIKRIKDLRQSGLKQREIAAMFGANQSQISRALTGKSYKGKQV